ncbi:MAG: DNA polymerase III subunit delta [Bacteroidia bacterium]|jgi:DNA polymerase-3 subunit delta|nr:DNA polymerase III subunit delta [Bacteroidia bacterium]
MIVASYKDIIKNIKKGAFDPLYILYGDEPYYILKIIETADHFISETNNENNLYNFDGKKNTLNDALLQLQEVGMFSSFKLIIFRDAHLLKDFQSASKDKNSALPLLLKFIQNPVPEHYMILAFEDPEKKLDERKTIIKEILQHPNVVAFKSEKVKDYKLKDWIKQYVMDLGRMIDDRSAFKLAENIGNDLMRIEKEIEKIIINTPDKREITEADINKYTFVNREYNIYELQKALAEKNILKAQMIVKYFGENKNDFPMERIIPSLNTYFTKVLKYHLLDNKDDNYVKEQLELPHPFFVKEYATAAMNYPRPKTKQILYLLKEYDLKSKKINNYSLENLQLLQELIWKIMH